jgi:hypothetical protein
MSKIKLFLVHDKQEFIEKAARQNFDRDVRQDIEDPSDKIPKEYYDEAKALLDADGENYLPEAPDFDWIVYKPQ